ncbi:hypothetical protein K239x_43700 [Planctomycetes bacterium K23_9]|uniref:Uncharacterized protein n=1 Tax=Stieleria marina TaxID=1930275 RepID=A0A517NZ04_9BACT|nr:hypothetical protein K239x_43700 [Planctomycetes bacterium K23_9]
MPVGWIVSIDANACIGREGLHRTRNDRAFAWADSGTQSVRQSDRPEMTIMDVISFIASLNRPVFHC